VKITKKDYQDVVAILLATLDGEAKLYQVHCYPNENDRCCDNHEVVPFTGRKALIEAVEKRLGPTIYCVEADVEINSADDLTVAMMGDKAIVLAHFDRNGAPTDESSALIADPWIEDHHPELFDMFREADERLERARGHLQSAEKMYNMAKMFGFATPEMDSQIAEARSSLAALEARYEGVKRAANSLEPDEGVNMRVVEDLDEMPPEIRAAVESLPRGIVKVVQVSMKDDLPEVDGIVIGPGSDLLN
jgi:hypothetical protein